MENNSESYQKLQAIKRAVDKAIAEIESDKRYQAKTADVSTNTPLALIQCSFFSKLEILTQIRDEIEKVGFDD